MGGFGSGRPSWGGRGTVEANRSLDVNKLKRRGCLQPGWQGGWEWTRDGERIAWIQMRAEQGALHLSYRYRLNDGEWQSADYAVPLVWVPCRFGGERPYFVCPGVVNGVPCRRRVLKLYGAGRYFLCRHCYGLAFASQSESEYDRALRRANKIRMRLGGEPGMGSLFPEKPKGMHWRTYERLRQDAYDAELLAEERFIQLTSRFLSRVDAASSKKGFWQ